MCSCSFSLKNIPNVWNSVKEMLNPWFVKPHLKKGISLMQPQLLLKKATPPFLPKRNEEGSYPTSMALLPCLTWWPLAVIPSNWFLGVGAATWKESMSPSD
jgi:hypothetical protein